MSDWDRIEKLVRKRKYDKVIAVACGLDDADRKALVDPLKKFERYARSAEASLWNSRSCLSIMGAAVLPNASALAPWLVRNGFWNFESFHGSRDQADVVDSVLNVLKARGVPWLPDLARRLADRLSATRFDQSQFRLVTALVELTGIDPPPTDGLVLGLVSQDRWASEGITDPRWLAVVPRMFEVTGVGRIIDAFSSPRTGWPGRIAELTAKGELDRAVMIDGVIAALQRGGRLGDVRGYLKVYEALDPDLSEIADRVRDYAPLLADAPSPVAGVAQRELFRADDAGKLSADHLVDVSRAVFLRSEKKLVRAQIDRLKKLLRREPGRVDDVLDVLGVVFSHDAADLQSKALDLVLAHASAATQRTRDDLAAVASGLPADLRAKAAKALGAVDAAPEPMTTLLPAPEEPAFPDPIGSPAELLEEIENYQHSVYNDGADMIQVERIIAALVAFAHRDREGLRAALEPFFAANSYMKKGHTDWRGVDYWHSISEQAEMVSLIGASVGPCTATTATPFPSVKAVAGEKEWRQNAAKTHLPVPQRVLAHRLHEISVGLAYAPRPMLLATPTETSGLIAPEVLLERLSRAAAEGWEPWENDLSQALLRLPYQRDTELAGRAADLGTDAGKRLAHWLSNECAVSEAGPLGELLAASPDAENVYYYSDYFFSTWPALLPAHTEQIASHIVPFLYEKTLRGRGGGQMLTELSHTVNQMGPQCARAFAHGLDAHDKDDRAEAVEALLVLAARSRWNPAALGQQIGILAAEVELSLNRVVPCLRDLAQSGAATHVWGTVAAALPPMLSPELERAPQRLADLLALAVDLVEQVRPTTSIPGLADVAARRGGSRMVTEAKRLVAALSG